MKRLIDLRQHHEDTGYNFAWWDTVTDKFESHCSQQAWETWEEFKDCISQKNIERYKNLCPEWVFKLKNTDI